MCLVEVLRMCLVKDLILKLHLVKFESMCFEGAPCGGFDGAFGGGLI
jgi:hypothetical protein